MIILLLGGIKNTNYKKLNLIGIKEFAGISFFKKKAPIKGAFNKIIYEIKLECKSYV